MSFRLRTLAALLGLMVLGGNVSAEEPILLIGTIVKWRYPEASLGQSQMSDAATVNSQDDRTVPSVLLKTTMTTPDSVEKVLAFYQKRLTRSSENDKTLGITPDTGRSVLFSDESEGRPFAFHTITVNDSDTSTLIIITRGTDEKLTHITWKRYVRLKVDG